MLSASNKYEPEIASRHAKTPELNTVPSLLNSNYQWRFRHYCAVLSVIKGVMLVVTLRNQITGYSQIIKHPIIAWPRSPLNRHVLPRIVSETFVSHIVIIAGSYHHLPFYQLITPRCTLTKTRGHLKLSSELLAS